MTFWQSAGRPVLADGAMGMLLLEAGASGCLEALTRTDPERITAIHQAYHRAGARVLLTHSFGANRLALAQWGLAGDVAALNAAAVACVRRALGAAPPAQPVWIVGDIGPTQIALTAVRALPAADVRAAFYEQGEALRTAGVDALLLETFTNAYELTLALEALAGLGLPVVVSVSPQPDGALWDGTPLPNWRALCASHNVRMIGLNCVAPTPDWFQLAREICHQSQLPLWLKCHAGLPGERLSAADFAKALRPVLPQVAVVGGCCGATPEHIAALSASL